MFKSAAIMGLAVLMLIASTSLLAQRGGMGTGRYDPNSEATIKGTVEKVERFGANTSMGGIHLIVKSENENIEVHLGPAAFVDKKMMFTEGDSIQIVGSKVTMMGKPVVIAREVKKGDQVLQLRDQRGVPVWSGGHGYRHRVS
jgi:DNA/RNA endonuclease YhcR with UshA esterase domain